METKRKRKHQSYRERTQTPELRERVLAEKRAYYRRNKDKVQAKNSEWRRRNRDKSRASWARHAAKKRKTNPDWLREVALKRRYSMTVEQFDSMKANQCGVCAICAKTPSKFHVDHSHVTGRVRGLLCAKCNTALGMLSEDVSAMVRMIAYVTQFVDEGGR